MRTTQSTSTARRPRRWAGPFAVLAGLASFFVAFAPPPESAPDSRSPSQAPVIPGDRPGDEHGDEVDPDRDGWLVGVGSPAFAQAANGREDPASRQSESSDPSESTPPIVDGTSDGSSREQGATVRDQDSGNRVDDPSVPTPTRRVSGTSRGSILTGGGPSTTSEPVVHPYFLGWSADVGSGRELLKPTLELGGVTVDPRSGWVYVATRDGKLICLVNGERRWEAELGAQVLAPPAVHREAVVVGVSNGVLHTFNKVTGERQSRVILEEELITQPVVVRTDAGLRAFVGSSAESLFAADIELGQRLWRIHRDAPPGFSVRGFATPIVTSDALYMAHADGVVTAVEPESGVVLWERRVSPPGDLVDVDSLATDNRLLFVASFSGGVLALNPETGATVWRADFPQAHHLQYVDGTLLAVAPGHVASLNPNTGSIQWSTRLAEVGMLSKPVVGSGLIAMTEDAGPLHFLEATTGAHVGSFTSGAGFSSPPTSAGRTLFVLSNGGRVYSLGLLPPGRE